MRGGAISLAELHAKAARASSGTTGRSASTAIDIPMLSGIARAARSGRRLAAAATRKSAGWKNAPMKCRAATDARRLAPNSRKTR